MIRRASSDRFPLSRPRTRPRGLPRRIASALFLACFLVQIAPVAWIVAPIAADGAIHPCGCTGLSCVCPHPASERAACHLPGDEVGPDAGPRVGESAAFDTCDPPAWSAPPTVPGVETGPVRLPGPVIAGAVVPASPHPARSAGDAPEPPPPRSPAVA